MVDESDLIALQNAVRGIHVSDDVKEYIVAIADATRNHGSLYLGASPRGSLALFRLVQAKALLEEREYALPDDVKALAYPALGHRVILSSAARIQGTTSADAIADVVAQTPVAGALPGA